MLTTNGSDYQIDRGSYWKGIALISLCHFAYLSFVSQLPSPQMRAVGYMLFALFQLSYVFPLAIFYKRREQGLTSKGIILVGVVSVLAAVAWFVYAVLHGTLPSITGS